MRIKLLNSILRILGVLMIVSIIPSCAFATENSSSNHMFDVKFGPVGNVTADHFGSAHSTILDSISKQISELQNFYKNVSDASNATELKEVLANRRLENECMEPYVKNRETAVMNVLDLDRIENVTDDNFTEVQTEIINSLGNATDMLNDQLNDSEISQDNNMTEEINSRITGLRNLSAEVSEASTAAELKEVVFTFMQTQTVDSIEKEIKYLQTEINDSNNMSENTTELSSKIIELTTLKEKISGAESLEDLKNIMYSSHGIPGMKDDYYVS